MAAEEIKIEGITIRDGGIHSNNKDCVWIYRNDNHPVSAGEGMEYTKRSLFAMLDKWFDEVF